ncbi:hypothetical protein [Rhizobium phage RHEph18]|uniref:hypothetical protein n=1 Tax=Rhizobium TaxID=379 RepID=UPI0007EB7D07|nr:MULTISPECIES: hypothetical protein [Rhizobium]ANL02679.1 hypothetical protein AMJ99_CH01092 [Rhizobium esperanzae]ANM33531.1 hypothetical protein AMK04_CH01093 [Rhizobium sp. N871]QIG73764.1 hypothetical protein EVC05_072 [Rhizobium phage RHph_N2]QXV74482.1 hypothetical protein [Rhizobium phage RHEph18]
MRVFKKQKALLLLMYDTFGRKPRHMGIGFYRNAIGLSTKDEAGDRFIPLRLPPASSTLQLTSEGEQP